MSGKREEESEGVEGRDCWGCEEMLERVILDEVVVSEKKKFGGDAFGVPL